MTGEKSLVNGGIRKGEQWSMMVNCEVATGRVSVGGKSESRGCVPVTEGSQEEIGMVSTWEELRAVVTELRDDRRRPRRGVSGPAEHDARAG